MNIRILAFDPGTAHMGYATLACSTDTLHTAKPQLTDDWGILRTTIADGSVRDRIDLLGAHVTDLIHQIQPTHIAIEDFTEQGKRVGKTYKEMAWLTEHLRLVGRAMHYQVAIFENGEWKRQTLGIRGATKIQVQHFIQHRVQGTEVLKGLPKNRNHIWDSVGVGYCLFTQLQRGVSI